MSILLKTLIATLVALGAACAQRTEPALNRLTKAEKSAGWKLLFDGRTLKGWRTPSGEPTGLSSWTVESGALKAVMGGRFIADLWTKAQYGNFDLTFEWRVSPGGNSGIRYLIQDWARGQFRASRLIRRLGHESVPESELAAGDCLVEFSLGLEYQVVDDWAGGRRPNPNRASGALYALFPVSSDAPKPVGEWNRGRLLVQGNHVEHWLNGTRVVAYVLESPELRNAIERDRRAGNELLIGKLNRKSPITLQHHLSEVWFRNIKVRERQE